MEALGIWFLVFILSSWMHLSLQKAHAFQGSTYLFFNNMQFYEWGFSSICFLFFFNDVNKSCEGI